jgi:hypothetical protein
MSVEVLIQRLPEPAAMFIVGLGLVCLVGQVRQRAGNLRVLHRRILQIQHALNPLHVYCRLVDRGLNKNLSMSICKYYGVVIYSWLSWCTVVAVKVCRP